MHAHAPPTVESRLSLYYALMFGSVGLVGPFLVPWLAHRGVDPALGGLAVAAPSIAMVLTGVLLGSCADRLRDWRTAILVCDWTMLGLSLWLLWHRSVADILVVLTLVGLVAAVKVPILDGATLSLTRRRGTEYGPIRAVGSLGFIVALFAGGLVFEHLGFGLFVPLLVGSAALRVLASHALPRFRAASDVAAGAPAIVGGLRHRGFLLVVTGAALIGASHAFFGAFGMLHWLALGHGTATSSMLWVVAVGTEIVLMFRFASIARRLPARHCLFVAGVVAVFRWGLSTLEPPLWGLFALQALHGVTFGLTFVATVSFISRRVADVEAARAQALSATLATAASAVATLVAGLLYERVGAHGYWAMASLAGTGVALVAASYRTDLEEMATMAARGPVGADTATVGAAGAAGAAGAGVAVPLGGCFVPKIRSSASPGPGTM